MKLLPIQEKLEDNEIFITDPLCQESLYATVEFYRGVGFSPPWIGYYAMQDNELVGCAGFKGRPINDKVEIAYGTFEKFQHQGIGAAICKEMVNLSLETDPNVRIMARTLPEKNFSTRILEKNNFKCLGTVIDVDDGEVWEWEFDKVL